MNPRGTLSPGQSATAQFPIVGEREAAPWTGGEWSLRVDGLVVRLLTLALPELLRLPRSERTWDTICVTGWTHFGHHWGGVMLSDVLAVAQPLPDARFVRFVAHSPRNHDTSLTLEYASEHVMLAYDLDGQPLPVDHGGPLRSVCEGKYFYKSVKWLTRIELLAEDEPGYWERDSAYHNEADPWKEQRYDPKPLPEAEFARRVRERDFSGAFAIVDEKFKTLTGTDLSDCNFEGARIKACRFLRVTLRRARATGGNFTRCIFIDSDLRDADLSRCDLEGADFRGADLRGADLRETFLTATQFADRHRETKIEGARLLRSDIDKAGLGDDDRAFLLNAANGAIFD
ncbi:MAG TPA: molybdopterin-dependent oxidoreductase [Thermoanaerobaculia bacterium]|nr:molybdopterin-dependent oxidoreductase [Thermoanaerobaculia bacterium]